MFGDTWAAMFSNMKIEKYLIRTGDQPTKAMEFTFMDVWKDDRLQS